MEWVQRSSQIHSTFSNLGFAQADGYHVNENCNAALESILYNITSEDKNLRTYRRTISFGQNINKDLIPLLIHAKEDKTIELVLKILVNLTIPIECLLSVDVISKNDFGRHTVFEINNLLSSAKTAFTDHRATRVLTEFLKKNMDVEQKDKLSLEQCTNISNILLLMRNILHIPEDTSSQNVSCNGTHTVQNQILWNIFSQSVDKILIKLMTIADAPKWGVTMVQLIALLYKDQHVVTLHKLLNLWLEGSLSESSEDNESNTSPPDRGRDDSSPMLTSDQTSDSSDTGGSGKSNAESNSVTNGWDASSVNDTSSKNSNQPFQPTTDKTDGGDKTTDIDNNKDVTMKSETHDSHTSTGTIEPEVNKQDRKLNPETKAVISENSDCGYGTQIENQESISTSSNEDDLPSKKPVHQKTHGTKQRANNKPRVGVTLQEKKRKKIVKRGKVTIVNVQGLSQKTPTDDDISNVLKEFTVDFLLKGYNSLVQTLHEQILTNLQLEIDTSHFFWLVTYFLKFATQIELDLEHVNRVLSFEIMSYLTAEGVNLCEQFELAIKLDGNNLKPSIRRLHLVVTAIREFVQAIEMYKKFSHLCKEDQKALVRLQVKICDTEELRSLLVLLLRHYNPKYQSKQYLQDLIVTNHIFLLFLDSVMQLPDYHGSTNMHDHIRQFATPEIMFKYGLLLEDYASNGEFVNDCIFTLMHHVGGDLGSLITLFQPKILKTFTSIWKTEFEICDDWSDLIEYVINTFIKKPHALQSMATHRIDVENFDDDEHQEMSGSVLNKKTATDNTPPKDRWTEDELSALGWNYMQCNTASDIPGEVIKMFKEDGIIKSRDSVIQELFKQNMISKAEFDKLSRRENDKLSKTAQMNKETRNEEIAKLCQQLALDGRSKFLHWLQKVLLDTCYAKICLQKKAKPDLGAKMGDSKLQHFDLFKKDSDDTPVVSPVSYHSLLFNQSIPLVPWNCQQAAICKDLKFLHLLHKLGFHMPVDSGKVFIRIPNFWTADFLYDVAGKILPIDTTQLKFSLSDIPDSSCMDSDYNKFSHHIEGVDTVEIENFYQVHKQKHLATMVNFTPMPGCSFNADCGEENNQNWLEMIQKAQDYNLTLNLPSHTISAKEAGNMEANIQDVEGLVLPTVMSVKQDNTEYSTLADPDDDTHSICDTASVASDLTRMYVSDEDEKPETLILRPTPMDFDDDVMELYPSTF